MSVRLISVLAFIALVAGAALALDPAAPTPVMAQRPTPDPGRGLAIYGRRYVVPLPQEGGGASAELALANAGWTPAHVAVLAVGAAQAGECPLPFQPSQILDHRCDVVVPASGQTRLPLPNSAATHLLVYSLADAAGCAALDEIAAGRGSLTEWEHTVWQPGVSFVPSVHSEAAGMGVAVAGQPAFLDLAPELLPRFRNAGPSLPLVESGSTVQLVNAAGEYVSPMGVGAPVAAGECRPGIPVQMSIAPHSAARVVAGSAEGGLGFPRAAALSALAENRDESGWYAYGPVLTSLETRQLYAPLAAGLVDGLTSELWVTNEAVTATTQVDIVMLLGSGALHKLSTDPVPLCAGASRAYDITALAGVLPPSDRGGVPSSLSLRVTSTNLAMPEAPPISGALLLKVGGDSSAYAAASGIVPLVNVGGGRDVPLGGVPVWVVPDVKMNAGAPAATSVLVVQSLRGNARLYIDFYDENGQLVLDDGYFPTRGDAGLVIDLAQGMGQVGGGNRLHLPDGFRGSALIRGEIARDSFAVLAFDRGAVARPRPLQAAPMFALVNGVAVVRPNDPNVPTPTARATPERPTPAPTAPPTWSVNIPWSYTR